jgi:DNA-nicking Smr family endonuclease
VATWKRPRERSRGPDDDPDELIEVDLHGLTPAAALRRLEHTLHTARIQGLTWLRAITGRGLGNWTQQPILRQHVEDWLRSPKGARYGVADVQVERSSGGGSIRVQLRRPRGPAR